MAVLEETDEFKDAYRHRAGIEGIHIQAVRAPGLRRSRSIGLRKTHLGHVALAAAFHVIQLMSWLPEMSLGFATSTQSRHEPLNH